MSKYPQTNANLAQAQAVRSSTYPTRIHELPDFKSWFDAEYAKGGKTINTLCREGANRFPRYKLPSIPRLRSYVEKYLSQPVIVAPYTPEYQEHIRNFDSYVKLIEAAKELLRRYNLAEQRESAMPSPGRVSRSHQWFETYLRTLQAIVEIEIKLGLRAGLMPGNISLNQININNQAVVVASVQEVLADEAKLMDIRERLAKRRYAVAPTTA